MANDVAREADADAKPEAAPPEPPRTPLERLKETFKDTPQFRKMPFSVGGPLMTVAFWTTFATFCGALWRTPFVLFGDYPYHLSLAAILRRLMTPGSPEHALYETNLVSYNSLFHIFTAVLGLVMPVTYAGLVAITAYWLLLVFGVRQVLKATGHTTERLFALFPVLVGFPLAWGMLNFCLGFAIQLFALARAIARPREGATWRYDALTALIALVGMWGHLMGSAIVYSFVFAVLVARTMADRTLFPVRVARTLREGLPFLPAMGFAAGIYFHEQAGPIQVDAPTFNEDYFALNKLTSFFENATDYTTDHEDATYLKLVAVMLVACAVFRAPKPKRDPYPAIRLWIFAIAFFMYLLFPSGWWSTALLYQRITLAVVIGYMVMIPRGTRAVEYLVSVALMVVGIRSALNFVEARRAQAEELDDIRRVINEAPAGKAVIGVTLDRFIDGVKHPWAGHLVAYYVTVKGVEAAVNYANKMSLPIRYKHGIVPDLPPDSLARGTTRYNPNADYAQRFDLVLVHSDGDPKLHIWGARSSDVDIVSHHGNWFLFDAHRYLAKPRTPPTPSMKLLPDAPPDEETDEP